LPCRESGMVGNTMNHHISTHSTRLYTIQQMHGCIDEVGHWSVKAGLEQVQSRIRAGLEHV
jgi:hypothetical protein